MKPLFLSLAALFVLIACSVIAQDQGKGAEEAVARPATIERAKWARYPVDSSKLKPNGRIRHLSVHHTAVAKFRGDGTAKGELNVILNGHANGNQWGDIAYHYLIAPDGSIYEGRGPRYAANSGTRYLSEKDWKSNKLHSPAQVKEDPKKFPLGGTSWVSSKVTGERPGKITGHLTVCFVGNFEQKEPTARAKEAFYKLATFLLKSYHLTTANVWCHREVASSTCPGDKTLLWLRDPSKGRYSFGPGLTELAKRMK